jgi:hypothetical protein
MQISRLHALSILGSQTPTPQDMEIICRKGWRTFTVRTIKMSRKFTVGPRQNIENVYLSPPQTHQQYTIRNTLGEEWTHRTYKHGDTKDTKRNRKKLKQSSTQYYVRTHRDIPP